MLVTTIEKPDKVEDIATYSMVPIYGIDPRYARHYTIEILYHAPGLLIINKPHDVRIDGSTRLCPTIESLLMTAFPQYPKLYLIHQLDYVTSGVHCWGLTKQMTGKCGRLFQERKVKKTYIAIVHGTLQSRSVNAPIATTESMRMEIGTPTNPGRPSLTYITSLKHGFYGPFPVTLVKLEPYTGRRHQLRVHLESIGHPIVGDVMYEGERGFVAERCFLHALSIRIGLNEAEATLTAEEELVIGEYIVEKRNKKSKKKGCKDFNCDKLLVDIETKDVFSDLVRGKPYEVAQRREITAEYAMEKEVYDAARLAPLPIRSPITKKKTAMCCSIM